MSERVEEIRRQWSDNSGPKSPWTDVWDLLRAYDEQATALAQAERERDEKDDLLRAAAAAAARLALRANAARAEVERLKAALEVPKDYLIVSKARWDERERIAADLVRARAEVERLKEEQCGDMCPTFYDGCHCAQALESRDAEIALQRERVDTVSRMLNVAEADLARVRAALEAELTERGYPGIIDLIYKRAALEGRG